MKLMTRTFVPESRSLFIAGTFCVIFGIIVIVRGLADAEVVPLTERPVPIPAPNNEVLEQRVKKLEQDVQGLQRRIAALERMNPR